jgi:hypothetical protein
MLTEMHGHYSRHIGIAARATLAALKPNELSDVVCELSHIIMSIYCPAICLLIFQISS